MLAIMVRRAEQEPDRIVVHYSESQKSVKLGISSSSETQIDGFWGA